MKLKILIGVIAILLISFFLYINSGVQLSKETNAIISKVVESEVPELIHGETHYAKSGDLDIWYELIKPPGEIRGTVLLIMGHSSSAMLWTSNFYETFVDSGYQVIRYDNRDVGESTWIENWDKEYPYTLEDMAKDGIAVLDDANVERAHIIGASMGGMIAQRMAISHKDRVQSLTSIMSSGYMMDPDIEPVPVWFEQNFIKLGLRYLLFNSETGNVKFFVGVMQTLRGDGPYEINVEGNAQVMLYETRRRKGINQKAIEQQAVAIEASGSRLEELQQISAPTLVVHGKADPLVIFDHALKYAPLIPDATTLYIDGMGHDIPELYLPRVHEAIMKNMNRTAVVHSAIN